MFSSIVHDNCCTLPYSFQCFSVTFECAASVSCVAVGVITILGFLNLPAGVGIAFTVVGAVYFVGNCIAIICACCMETKTSSNQDLYSSLRPHRQINFNLDSVNQKKDHHHQNKLSSQSQDFISDSLEAKKRKQEELEAKKKKQEEQAAKENKSWEDYEKEKAQRAALSQQREYERQQKSENERNKIAQECRKEAIEQQKSQREESIKKLAQIQAELDQVNREIQQLKANAPDKPSLGGSSDFSESLRKADAWNSYQQALQPLESKKSTLEFSKLCLEGLL
jgi:hypothetical protein